MAGWKGWEGWSAHWWDWEMDFCDKILVLNSIEGEILFPWILDYAFDF